MPHIPNTAIEEMLRNADPQSAQVMAGILNGSIVAQIYCLSKTITEEREVPTLDELGDKTYYKTGKHAGELKTHKENVIIRNGCEGRLIGRVYNTGQVEAVTDDGQMYLRATRKRLDGAIGVECWCGNDSRIAPQEAGVIDYSGNAPTKEGLAQIFKAVQKNPTVGVIKNGRTEVDGFAFEEIQ